MDHNIKDTVLNMSSSYVLITTTPSARYRNRWKAAPPSCLGKYIIQFRIPAAPKSRRGYISLNFDRINNVPKIV